MIIAIMGLTGSGKSTVAARLAVQKGMYLFDMDREFSEEYRSRRQSGELVPAEDVKRYQRQMVEHMLSIEKEQSVVMAGFFLDDELPRYIERKCKIVWINLVTDNKDLLVQRVGSRSGHFPGALKVLDDNWPNRHDQIVGSICVDCGRDLELVIGDCVALL